MFALRERRMYVTQEDCEMAVAKVRRSFFLSLSSLSSLSLRSLLQTSTRGVNRLSLSLFSTYAPVNGVSVH